MKKFITIIYTGCSFLLSHATVRTVSNNPNSPGQYTNLQTAINASSSGDTIYVHGSTTNYGSLSIKKKLSLFGTGHKPNKANNLVSQLGDIQLDTANGVSGASGTSIIGFSLNSVNGYFGTGGTKNILISRNYFISGGTKIYVTGNNWRIENNIISQSSININSKNTIFILNNIFDNASILSSNQPNVLISNNIFFGNAPATSLNAVSNALLTNNIFYGSSANGTSVDNNIFSNNISYQTANDTLPYGTSTGSGNFVNQNPLFTNVTANNFNYSFDFSLMAISPGKNAGTDGKDIGIYGGSKPFVDMTGSPAIPQMKSVTLLNPMIPLGDSLHVIIKAKKQN